MQRVEVAEAQEQEEAREPDACRTHNCLPRPVRTGSDAAPRQRGIQHTDRDHRARQGHAVVRHECQKPRVDRVEAGSIQTEKRLVVRQDDARRGNHPGRRAGEHHRQPQPEQPRPALTPQRQLGWLGVRDGRLGCRQRLVDALRQARSGGDQPAVQQDHVGAGGAQFQRIQRFLDAALGHDRHITRDQRPQVAHGCLDRIAGRWSDEPFTVHAAQPAADHPAIDAHAPPDLDQPSAGARLCIGREVQQQRLAVRGRTGPTQVAFDCAGRPAFEAPARLEHQPCRVLRQRAEQRCDLLVGCFGFEPGPRRDAHQ